MGGGCGFGHTECTLGVCFMRLSVFFMTASHINQAVAGGCVLYDRSTYQSSSSRLGVFFMTASHINQAV